MMSSIKKRPGSAIQMKGSDASEAFTLPSCMSEELEYLQFHQVHEAASLLVDAFLIESTDNDEDASPIYSWVLEDLLLQVDDQIASYAEPPLSRRQRQREALHWLYCISLNARLEHDAETNRETACRCAFLHRPDQPPKMVCFFILTSHQTKIDGSCFEISPSKSKKTPWRMIRHGLLWFPILFGCKTFYRLIRSNDFSEALTEKFLSSMENPVSNPSSMILAPEDTAKTSFWNRSTSKLCSYRTLERVVVHPSMQGKGIGSFFLKKALCLENNAYNCTDVEHTVGDRTLCLLETDKERAVSFYSKLGFKVVKTNGFETRGFAPDVTTWLMVLSPSALPT